MLLTPSALLQGALRTTQPQHASGTLTSRSIQDLPDEMLIEIFKWTLMLHPQADFKLSYWSRGKDTVPDVIHLTHVCHRWRNIALTYLRFWARVDGRNRERLDAFAERSGGLPLWLSLTTSTNALESILSIYAGRVHRLDFRVKFGHTGPLPILREHLSSMRCFTISYEDIAARGRTIPSPAVLFGEETSSLTALAVVFARDWWPINRFPNLTHLYIVLNKSGNLPSSETLINLLSGTPMLQHLLIGNLYASRAPASYSTSVTTSTTPLPHIRSITFLQSNLLEVLDVLISKNPKYLGKQT